jgi:hypothetical protein
LRPYQVPVWLTLCAQGPVVYDPTAPLLLAVLDSGFNGNFALREEQLRAWAGVDPNLFQFLRTADLSRGRVDVRRANLWLHRNVPHSIEPCRRDPLHMELDEGIYVFRRPNNPVGRDPRPELPLLGMRAMRRNDLALAVDFRKALVWLSKPRFLAAFLSF